MPDNARSGRVDRPGGAPPDAHAGERSASGRHPLETGDLIIVRVESPDARSRYEFRVHGGSSMPVCFARFEQAATAGERIAQQKRLRLFFRDAEDKAPLLLRDFRPPGEPQR
jgi:hypothetical protein